MMLKPLSERVLYALVAQAMGITWPEGRFIMVPGHGPKFLLR